MDTVLTLLSHVLLTVLGLLILVVAAVVLVPTDVAATGRIDEDVLDGRVHARWGFGLVRVSLVAGRGLGVYLAGLRIWRPRLEPREHGQAPRARKKRRPAKRKRRRPARAWFRWIRRHRATLRRIGGRYLSTLRLRLVVRGQVGLGDPADTAAVASLVRALQILSPHVVLDVEPSYLDETSRLRGRAALRIWPVHWVAVTGLLALQPRTWGLVRSIPRKPSNAEARP